MIVRFCYNVTGSFLFQCAINEIRKKIDGLSLSGNVYII